MDYIPKPYDTAGISLDYDLMEITEILAKNTHENWAMQRLKDGWKYGENRDDIKKIHPGIVSYENLTEQEKDYDRLTSLETLKTIKLLGFEIIKK